MRLKPDPATRRPDPDPLPTDMRRVVLAGMAVWAVALVAALVSLGWLRDTGRGWWAWVPVAGLALGVVGLRTRFVRERRQAGE